MSLYRFFFMLVTLVPHGAAVPDHAGHTGVYDDVTQHVEARDS